MSATKRLRNLLNAKADELLTQHDVKSRVPRDALVSVIFEDGHIHTHHLAQESQEVEDKIIDTLVSDLGKTLKEDVKGTEFKKPLIFKNRQAVGDILMMTCAVRDFHKSFPDLPINVSTTAMHIWDNNPHIDRSLNESNADVIEIGPSWLTNSSNRDDRHFANAFRISIEQKLGIEILQGEIKPDIWLTREEINDSPVIKPPYWIIVAGEKGDWTAKTYPFHRWQEFVSKYPEMTFVQVGAREHRHPELTGDNIISMIGKTQDRNTGIRDLFKLFYHAEGSMGLVSFQMHLAAAFGMPCIVIAGAREPARFTRFKNHQYLCTDGCLPCASINACWHCDMSKTCKDIVEEKGVKYPRCVDIIKTEDLMRSFEQLYEGNRLSFQTPRVPTIPNPIVETDEGKVYSPIVRKKREALFEDAALPKEFGFEWGGAHITNYDWLFIKKVISRYKVQRIMEFGIGLSTLLFHNLGIEVVAYEDDKGFLKKFITKYPGIKEVEIRSWNGVDIKEDLEEFDMVFVDGPFGGPNREWSIKISSEVSDVVVVHDAGRKFETKWQEKYLKGKFETMVKGGTRTHLWSKQKIDEEDIKKLREEPKEVGKEKPEEKSEEKPLVTTNEVIKDVINRKGWTPGEMAVQPQKVFRLVFNGRGEGGAESSTTFLVNEFARMGWRSEYVHLGDRPSGTFVKKGSSDVYTSNDLDAISEPCDILVLYTNDWVWEFPKDAVRTKFEGLRANKKVMIVNYRLGTIGKTEWTKEWDKYLFLNSSLEADFVSAYFKSSGESQFSINSKVLAPPIDLSEYFKNEPDYGGNLKLVRHSSQGDSKYPIDFNNLIEQILKEIDGAEIRLMPAPSFIGDFGDFVKPHKRNVPAVNEFLGLGNCFWYKLPEGYGDMGPKVVMEAMASGLPIIADNHTGPKDRIINGETGILCDDFDEHLEAMKRLNDQSEREMIGKAAREYARKNFSPMNWIKEIIE